MKFKFLIICALTSALASCADNVFIGATDFEDEVWRTGQNAVFEFDTSNFGHSSQSMDVFVRYKSAGQGDTFALYVKTDAPDRTFWIDTIQVALNSTQSGAVRTVTIPYRSNVMWVQNGGHCVSLFVGRSLPYIVSAGIEIK